MNKTAKLLLGAAAIVSCYAALYVGNSLAGGYWLQPIRDGKHLWSLTGFSMHDAVQWQPRFGYVEKYEKDKIGILFYPLIRLDQKFWHSTRYASDAADFQWLTQDMPSSKVHPYFRSEFIKSKEPNQPLQRTSTAVTNRAAHASRQLLRSLT